MKIAIIIVRVLMGLLFIFASGSYFLNLITPPEMTGNIRTFNEGLAASGYLFTLIKLTELVCGIAFVTGRYVPLAIVVIAPVILNIFLVHAYLAPEGLPVAIFLVAANAFLAFAHLDRYQPLLEAR